MKKLFALIVGVLAIIGAVVTGLFFWRRKQGSWDATWKSVKDTATSFGNSTADQAGKAGEKVTSLVDSAGEAASNAADAVKDQLGGEA
jgi:hypothetical protein